MFQLVKLNHLFINISLILVSLLLASLFLFYPYLKNRGNIKEFIKGNKERLVASILLLVGFISRVAFLDLFPGGLNQDEASAGYDAFAIMNWGIDRNGNKLPVHLVAWGSGQNALYSYVCIPFLFIFGVNEISLRLPMALVGCVTLYLLYRLLNKKFDSKIAIIGLFILVISPWHLMKSRWGLESNFFPNLVFIGFYFLINYLDTKKIYHLIISSIILGVSSYSYGTSYFFLFFFVIIYCVYLLIRKSMKIVHSIIHISIIGVICIPIILFLYINIFNKESISLLCFTIPKLNVDRFQSVTNLFSDSFFESAKDNFKNGLNLLLTQYDNLPWNGIPQFGYMYLITLPFTIVGLFYQNKENKDLSNILRIWLVVSFLMLFIVSPNINRINIIFIPIIIFSIFGIYEIILLSKKLERIILPTYLASFICFSITYATTWNDKIKSNFFNGLGDSIQYAYKLKDVENIYITSNVNMPYIFALYYTEFDVNEYIETVEYYNEGGAFERVKSFSNFNFYLPSYIEEGNVYILKIDDNLYKNIDLSIYNTVEFGLYRVIDARK